MNADDEPTFDEIGSALAFVARDQALLVEQCEHLVMSLPPSPGLQADLNALRRRAHALGRAHALFTTMSRYEPEVLRLVALGNRYRGRPRWWRHIKKERTS